MKKFLFCLLLPFTLLSCSEDDNYHEIVGIWRLVSSDLPIITDQDRLSYNNLGDAIYFANNKIPVNPTPERPLIPTQSYECTIEDNVITEYFINAEKEKVTHRVYKYSIERKDGKEMLYQLDIEDNSVLITYVR